MTGSVALLSLLLACGGPGVELPEVVAEACGSYADDADLLANCLTRQAPALDSVEQVDTVCSLVGRYEAECRQLWSQRQLGMAYPRDRSELLAACAGFPDCAFEVIDMWPADDVDQQLLDCVLAGPYQHSCIRHSLNRWLHAEPDAAEVVRLGSTAQPMGTLVAEYLAIRVACDGVGECVAGSPLQAECQRLADQLRANPGRCPTSRGPRGPQPSDLH